ncbi:MAG: ubiquinol-cytochrome C reductase, partial [Actinomycetota bacterium]
MNNENSGAVEKLSDPGLPEHVHRKTDVDPRAAKKAERQVSILFALSAIGTILFIYSYIWIPDDTFIFLPITGTTNAHQ